jgi:hypothetical protein
MGLEEVIQAVDELLAVRDSVREDAIRISGMWLDCLSRL